MSCLLPCHAPTLSAVTVLTSNAQLWQRIPGTQQHSLSGPLNVGYLDLLSLSEKNNNYSVWNDSSVCGCSRNGAVTVEDVLVLLVQTSG